MRGLLLPGALLLSLALRGQEDLALRLQREAVAFAEAQAPAGQLRVQALRLPLVPKLPPGEVQVEAASLSKREPVGPCFVSLRLKVNGRLAAVVRVDLQGTWYGQLLKARGPLPRKTVPTPEQLENVAFEGAPPAGALTEWPEGYRLRVQVAPGKILTRSDLEPVPLIVAGDRVRLMLQSGALSVGTEATAMSPGAKGDKVRLEVLGGKKQVQAVVTGKGEAELRWSQN